MLIGLVLTLVAVILARESKSLLIGERAAPALMLSVLRLAEAERGVVSARGTITVQLAPDQIVAALSVEFEANLLTAAIEAAVECMEDRIKSAHPEIVTLFIKPQTTERFRAWQLKQFGIVDPL